MISFPFPPFCCCFWWKSGLSSYPWPQHYFKQGSDYGSWVRRALIIHEGTEMKVNGVVSLEGRRMNWFYDVVLSPWLLITPEAPIPSALKPSKHQSENKPFLSLISDFPSRLSHHSGSREKFSCRNNHFITSLRIHMVLKPEIIMEPSEACHDMVWIFQRKGGFRAFLGFF